jgi:hypothetical protein
MTIVAVDLDRTLIYSAAALGLTGPDAQAPALLVAEVHEGVPISYLTTRAGAQLRELAGIAVVVPTTTRTLAQYRRIRLPEWAPQFAVTTNGGQLLVDGTPDPDWARQVRAALSASAPLAEVSAYLRAAAAGGWVLKRRVAEDLFTYLVVNRAEMPRTFVAELTSWCALRGWTTSVQGRKVYCVPDGMTKRRALTEVVRRTGADGYLAAGDSLLDADLLIGASAGVRPAHGELAELEWHRAHIEITDASGVRAGEEIIGRLIRLAKQ